MHIPQQQFRTQISEIPHSPRVTGDINLVTWWTSKLLFAAACNPDIYVRYFNVNTGAFLRQVRRYARRHSLEFRYDPRRGKGSHGRIYLADRLTTVKSANKTIAPGLLHKMLKDLRIDPKDF